LSERCMDAIPQKKCCQMSKISLFSQLIAPCGAGANSVCPVVHRHKAKKH
jgi:hypothetical protein